MGTLPHFGRNIIPKSDCVQAFSRWQCFLVNTKLIWITAPQPDFFFPCHISSFLPLNLKAHRIRGGTKLYAWTSVLLLAPCMSLFSTPSDLTKLCTLQKRLNPWPRLTQFQGCLSRPWLIIFKQLSPGYVITTLHIRPRRTTQAWKGFLLGPRVSNCVKHFYLQSVVRSRGVSFTFYSEIVRHMGHVTWQSYILLLVINSSHQVATSDLKKWLSPVVPNPTSGT